MKRIAIMVSTPLKWDCSLAPMICIQKIAMCPSCCSDAFRWNQANVQYVPELITSLCQTCKAPS
jgi:hypothetical protein